MIKLEEPEDESDCENCSNSACFFSHQLQSHEKSVINQLKQSKKYIPGQKLSFEDGGKYGFHIICSGHVELMTLDSKKNRVISLGGKGDMIGFGNPNTCKYEAISIQKTNTCFFPNDEFEEIAKRSSDILYGIVGKLLEFVQFGHKRITVLSATTVKSRIAGTLLELAERFGNKVDKGISIDINLDRKAIANLSGTGVESVARTLTEFEKDGAVVRNGRNLIVLDANKLELAMLES